MSLAHATPADAWARPYHQEKIAVFQNVYADGQDDLLEEGFIPHDGRRNANTHYREVGLFMRLYHSGMYKTAEYVGIVSPKFGEKANISGKDFIRFIECNPGYDVYFINPFPCNAYYSFNVWHHGELCHDELIAIAQELFDQAEVRLDLASLGRNSHSTLLYCNYWVGNERFWHRFMKLILPLVGAIEKLPSGARNRLFSLDPEYPDPVPILPFIFERLFSTLLLCDKSICGLAYPHTRELMIRSAEGNLDEPILVRSFIDAIDDIDMRGEYNQRDMLVFEAVARLKRLLVQDRIGLVSVEPRPVNSAAGASI